MTFSCKLSRTYSTLALSVLAALPWAAAHGQTPPQGEAAHAAQLQQRAAEREKLRAEIAVQRQAIAQRQHDAEKECWQRFAVENCLGKARAAARDEDSALHERELGLNREERQEKAKERLRAIEQKKRDKQAPPPMIATPRDQAAKPTAEERQTQAQERAADQARRVQAHEAEVANKLEAQAQERANAVQAQQEKLKAAEQRRANKAADIQGQQGAPLPIPTEIPQ